MVRCPYCAGPVLALDDEQRCLLCAREPNERHASPEELAEIQSAMADEIVARAHAKARPLRDEWAR